VVVAVALGGGWRSDLGGAPVLGAEVTVAGGEEVGGGADMEGGREGRKEGGWGGGAAWRGWGRVVC